MQKRKAGQPHKGWKKAAAKTKEKTKRPKPYIAIDRFGVLNACGDLWTSNTFETPAAAEKYVADFWQGIVGIGAGDLSKYKAVRVRVTISALP